ncbi:sulfite exporter TauE/SafE family protein [Bacillus luteolus]|uniref:Sulfite exporter TauE/SafE family protein n=1 Tax=Litchfieldia luteola TaxID=682179 RepID=A0ABR9QEH8_9BACI|nr:sulfite exporter TauE/SafE family protein [Cytobacillus luteolus]MBE4906826.1 sulfite exporter TauE/SafE family protein [Cytobacillus luteolus]MBP1940520.1 cytochrome c biogenesis protein CcdA [Cytobacillus luteolus]
MYELINQIGYLISQPFNNLARSFETVPILFAFLLGIVGSMVPCQLTANVGAMTLYGNKSFQKGLAWADVLLFTLGKITVFSGLGLLVWLLGREFQSELTVYFPWFKKIIGPLFILVGFYMLGLIKLNGSISLFDRSKRLLQKGKSGSFFLGASFSLGFCPTMFVLFFITLMPVVLSTSYGMVLPSLFAIGTTLPLLLVMGLIWYFGASGLVLRKSRKVGANLQRIAGILLIIIGLFDTITYWTI